MFRRVLSILLCGCLLAGSFPVTGFAAEDQAVETTETTVDNTGGAYRGNADASDLTETGESAVVGNGQEAGENETRTTQEETAEEGRAEDSETAAETNPETKPSETEAVSSEEMSKTETVTEEMSESETQSEGAAGETAESTEMQTETLEEETDTEEQTVNSEGEETVAPTIQEVQEGGRSIKVTVDRSTASGYLYLYWREKGTRAYDYRRSEGTEFIITSVKPNTTYQLQLRSSDENDLQEQVYDEREITTTDYKFAAQAQVVDVTTNSAKIEVTFTDYDGVYPSGSITLLYAGTEYQDAFGRKQTNSGNGRIEQTSETKGCTVTLSLSNLEAGHEYTLPVWVAEYDKNKTDQKVLQDVTFTTEQSKIADRIEFAAATDEADKTKANYTISLSNSDALNESYNYTVGWHDKEAPAGVMETGAKGTLNQSGGYQFTGSAANLYAGVDYEFIAVIDGVVKTAEMKTDGLAPEITLTPLSFGGKLYMDLKLTEPSSDDVYKAKAYVDLSDTHGFSPSLWVSTSKRVGIGARGGWIGDDFVEFSDGNQRECLIYNNEYITAGTSYIVRIDILRNEEVIISKYLTLDTSEIELDFSENSISGRKADIACAIRGQDEYFDWDTEGDPLFWYYYRVKGSAAAWERGSYGFFPKGDIRIDKLTPNTEYEVKITNSSEDNANNIVYGTTGFKTAEGVDKGVFNDVKMRFSGFDVSGSGTYTPSDYADEVALYRVESDSTGKVLAESYLSSSASHYIYLDGTLQMETAEVWLKAVETLEERDADGNPVTKEYLSEKFSRVNAPKDIQFSISDISTGVASLHANLTYTGDMCLGDSGQSIRAALYYGKSGEELGAVPKTSYVYYSKDGSMTQRLTFNDLEAGTVYHGKLIVYVGADIDKSVLKQEITLKDFTTKADVTYPLERTFPDARLRALIVSQTNIGSSATEVTAAQLEKITYISANRSSFDTEAIRDLTGIDLLTGLESLYIRNNEISDASAVDWSKLTALKSLDLTGNDLAKIPDLSKNAGLTYVYLNENMIPAEEFETVSAKMPEGVHIDEFAQYSQRVGGLQVIAEETYYQRSGKSPLVVKIKGYKTGLPYEFRYSVDGNAVTLPLRTWSSDGNSLYYNIDTGIAVGSHTLTVEMYQKDEKKEEKSVAFKMAEGGTFVEEIPSRFNAKQDYYSLRVYSDQEISAVYMQKGGSIIAMASDAGNNTSTAEYRYKTLSSNSINLNGSDIYSSWVSLRPVKYRNPEAGTYDLRVVYSDETEDTLQDVIEIISKAFVQGGSIGYDYDSTGSSFYLSMTGYGFDAAKLEYAFTYDGKPQAAEYINAKEISDGYIVKFKKSEAWTPKEGSSVQVRLTPKSGYDVVLNTDTFNAYISQGIYYCAYNQASNKVEVGVTSNLRRENVVFKLSRYSSPSDASNDSNVIETIEVTPEIVTETISYLLPVKDAEVYKLPGGSYRLDMTCGEYSDYETFSVYTDNTNYWSGSQYVIEGAGDTNFYYYTEIPFVSGNQDDFKAEITSGSLASPLNAKRIWTYSYSSNAFTTAGITFDMSKLAQGSYTVTLYYKDEKLSAYTVTVLPGEHFVITSASDSHPTATWIDDSSFRVYVLTANTAASDEFTVSLTDIFGNKVEGLKTEVANRYSDSVYLKVTGLAKEDAYRYYYIHVTHNKLGEAYKTDLTTKFYADERGKYTNISDNRFTYTTSNNRAVGVGMYSSVVFPVTLKIYRPYDTDLVTSIVINKNDLESGTGNPAWYYFKETLIDMLPDQDVLYDIAVIDSNGQTGVWTRRALGLREGAVTSTWTVSPARLNLNLDSEQAKTGIITVAGNKGTPAYQSENTNVATVAADKTDKNKAVVTAVAEGTANISITADGITKTVVVTVTKEPVKPTGISITAPENAAVGSKVEISASVTPAGAWTQQSSITWTSSDSSVISIPAGSNGLVVEVDALKAGSAVITASLDGTEFTASCEIVVEKEISDDEQDEIAKEIGSLYFLEGADDSLGDVKLPDGWSWEDPAQKLTADNSHPIQDFGAVYNKDDVSFERYLDVHVSKLDDVCIAGMSTVNSGKEALYTCMHTYIGADPANGYEVSYQWTPGQNLTAQTDTDRRITVKVSGSDTLAVRMTVTNTTTGKSVSGDAELAVTAGEIPDSEPELENKKITLYKNSTQHVPIGLVAKDGNAITAVKTDNTDFQTEKDENGEWLIWLADGGKYAKKTKVPLTLTVTTESGTDYTKQLAVTVDVTEITTKNVKFKQTLKPNAAYSSADVVRAEFTVSSKYIIEEITAADGSENGPFTVKSYDSASGLLVLEANASALNKDTKTYAAKAKVQVRDYGTWTLDVKVAVQNKKPSMKLENAVILSGADGNASVALYNGKTEVSCRDYTITKTAGDNVTLAQDGDRLQVAYSGSKNGNYKVKIRKNTWAPGVETEITGKISLVDIKKAKLAADLSKVTINISEGYSSSVTVMVGISGSSVSADITAAPAKDKDAQALAVQAPGSGKFRITPNDGAKKGSYKVTVNGSVNGTAVKGTSITVTLTDKAPEVKLSAKGSINLANRDGTCITYTPTLKNLPSTLSIKRVQMDRTAADSAYFNVKLNSDGKVIMTAVTGKTMNAKTKYKPVLIFTLSNGKTLRTDSKFTVKVTNKLPKITATTLSSALCKANTGHRASYKLSAGNGYIISNVTLKDTGDTNHKVTFDSKTSIVYISFTGDADMKAGRKTMPCQVYIKGADNTTKPLTVKLKAVVY